MEITAERLQFQGGKNVYYVTIDNFKSITDGLFSWTFLGDALNVAQGWGAECKMRGD
jgi:hypothetical protein